MKHPEWDFQAAAYAYLRKTLPVEALVWATDHAGARSPAQGARLKRRGIIPGIPDLFVWSNGRLIGLELKVGTNTATEDQKLFGMALRHCIGGHWFMVRTLEDVEIAMLAAGIRLRATTLTAKQREDMRYARAAMPQQPAKAPTTKPSTNRIKRVEAVRSRVMF